MFPYILLLFILLTINFLGLDKTAKKYKPLFVIISFLWLWLFSGLRYQVGMDYTVYEDCYNQSSFGILSDFKEPGFAFMFYICKKIGIPFYVITLLIAFISIYLIYKFIFRYSALPFLSILIFYTFAHYYTYSFNVMRQVLASYIFLASINLIVQRKLLKYVLVILFTMSFVHMTAIILLPLYFILQKYYSLALKIFLITLSCMLSGIIITIIGNIEAYSIYLNFENYASGLSITTVILILLSLLFLIYETRKSNKEPLTNIIYNINYLVLLFLSISICFTNHPLILVFTRFAIYFTPIYLILLPNLVSNIRKPMKLLLTISILSILYSGIFILQLKSGGEMNKFIPYKTVLDK